jgi:hypothetical protein
MTESTRNALMLPILLHFVSFVVGAVYQQQQPKRKTGIEAETKNTTGF